ncbi:ATP-binding cassette domain-containing protein, partial [Mammaliicoccus sciuri]|uniref:ATP-binding cassette domain-containing protein n=2 Tax=Mammaliicoccus sciuri TaxID=1296 RepID=UPI00227025BE
MLEMSGVHKAFGQNKVLTGVDFKLKEASVHALMGENGAGKSTLMKILVGIHEKDAGQINYHNQEVVFKDAQMSEEAGITFIHQELNIWPELTVLENLFIGKEIRNKFGILNEKKMKQEALKVFGKLNFNISMQKVAGKCSIGEQQMIEIAKALMTNAKIIIMDEPTAALTDKEITQLFKLIK